MADHRLNRSFYLSEFQVSATAARMGRTIVVPPDKVPNVLRLVDTVLQPLRDAVRRPVVVLSGYRPPWLNDKVGGSKKSAHMDARAADITVPGMTPAEVVAKVHSLALPVDQCILEFDQWVHLGIEKPGDLIRHQYLRAYKLKGATTYEVLA